jgi:hypothetical protein
MRVWVAGVVLFFVMAELYPWVQGLSLPLPLMVVAGLGLAIASNWPALKGSGRSPQLAAKPAPTASPSQPAQPANPAPPPQRPPTQLPNLNPAPPAPPPRPISFTIRKPGNS